MDYPFVAIVATLGLVVLVIAGSVGSRETDRRRSRQLARIERKLDLMLGQLGVEDPEPHLQEVIALARAGQKIKAIKTYRDETGADLREAKEAVDRLAEGPA